MVTALRYGVVKTIYNKDVIPKQYFPALTGLRFFLAIWVVLHHLTGSGMLLEPWARALPPAFYTLIRAGYLAVGMFFVLSGFVLAQSYQRTVWNRASLVSYAVGRMARVYPVYALSLLVAAPYIVLSTVPERSRYIADYLFLLQGWMGKLPVQWNTPAWSLSCEIFFYLCFPLAALATYRLGRRATVFAAIVLCFLPAALWFAGVPDRFKPLIHLADFLLGVTASRVYDLLPRSFLRRGALLYVPAAVALTALMLHPLHIPSVLDLNGFLRPFTALALIGLALAGGWPARFFSLRPFVFLGKASYALYILHIPLLWSFLRWSPFWFPGMPPAVVACFYIAAAVAVSALVFHYMEEPANRWLRALAPTSPPRPNERLARKAGGTLCTPSSDSVRSSTYAPAS